MLFVVVASFLKYVRHIFQSVQSYFGLFPSECCNNLANIAEHCYFMSGHDEQNLYKIVLHSENAVFGLVPNPLVGISLIFGL